MTAAPAAAAAVPHAQWDRAADAGWSKVGLAQLDLQLGAGDSAALMIVQGGQIVHEWGDTARPYHCHSIRKSMLAVIMGEDVDAERIRLDATLAELGIDDNEGLTDRERQATVYDLLTARSGVYHPAGYETGWMQSIKEARHSHGPGTFWCYNNWDFNALGSIFVQATGKSVGNAFATRIARPIGMEDFDLTGAQPSAWTESFAESRHDAYPFRLSARDLARFGLLCLRGGDWLDTPLVRSGWMADCLRRYSHAGTRGAYGYMWWLERDGVLFPGVHMPTGSYAAFGAGGHYCVVIPDRDLVVVHRVDTDTTGRQVDPHRFGALMRVLLEAAP